MVLEQADNIRWAGAYSDSGNSLSDLDATANPHKILFSALLEGMEGK